VVKKYLAVLLVVACGKSSKAPPPAPQDAAKAIDAVAAVTIDAPQAPKKPVPTKVVVGLHASCAVMSDATLRCWGANAQGQLGDGTTSDHPTPVTPALKGVLDVALGAAHACALLDDGSVACWGDIGFGKGDHLALPTGVPGINDAKRVFAVGAASCATMSNGAFVCWGDIDEKGHLRLSGGAREHRVPTPGEGLAFVVALTEVGALRENGDVDAWGASGTPRHGALSGITEIAAAGDGVCGLTKEGDVVCTGGAPHCGATAPKPARPAPKAPRGKTRGKKAKAPAKPAEPAAAFETLALPKARHLAFDVGLCVVTTTGHLQCLQPSNPCELDSPWPGLAKIDFVDGHCARSTDGTVRCWEVDRKSRTVGTINGVTGAVQMASSSSHGCALLGDHHVVCWGANTHGELGRGVTDTAAHPEAAPVAL
jgi:hypothetical protein